MHSSCDTLSPGLCVDVQDAATAADVSNMEKDLHGKTGSFLFSCLYMDVSYGAGFKAEILVCYAWMN